MSGPHSREWYAARRLARLAAGLCASCGVREHRPDRTRCEQCADAASVHQERRRLVAAEKGVCEACGTRRRWRGQTRCKRCRDRYLPAQLERDRERRRQQAD